MRNPVSLPCGRGEILLAPPPGALVLRKRPMPVVADPAAALRSLLAQSDLLVRRAGSAESACVLVCDETRPVPNDLLLPPLLERLSSLGLSGDRVTILVATGLHRSEEGGRPGPMPAGLETIVHDARDGASHRDLGRTDRGTPIRLDARFVEADLRLMIGLVEPHFMAGFSGGRKLIAPGIAAEDTIRRLHASALLDAPGAELGRLDGNPVHEEMLDIAALPGPVLALNLVLDEERRICHLGFGDLDPCHREAVVFFRRYSSVVPERRADLVVTSAAGHPLDATYYQTVKAMNAALPAVKPGGTLLVVSGCTGLGSPAYRRAQERLVSLGVDGYLAWWQDQVQAPVDAWQTARQAQAAGRVRLLLHAPLLGPEDRALTGLECVDDPNAILSGSKRPTLIPEGPYVLLESTFVFG